MQRIRLNISPLLLDIQWPGSALPTGFLLPRRMPGCFSGFIDSNGHPPHETLDVVSTGLPVHKSEPAVERLVSESFNLPLFKFPFTQQTSFIDTRGMERLKPFYRHPLFRAMAREADAPHHLACRLLSGGCLLRNQRTFRSALFLKPFTGRPIKLTSLAQAAYFVCAMGLPRLDALLLHGVGLTHLGNGVLFLGRSGSGKSTIARFSGTMPVISDDGIIVQRIRNEYRLLPTPFDQQNMEGNLGTETTGQEAPLKMGVFLEQDQRVFLEKVHPAEACCRIIKNHIHFFGYFPRETAETAFSRITEMCRRVPFYRLHFRKDSVFRAVVKKQLCQVLDDTGGLE